MTTGEKLVSLSSISTGTAEDHLLNITTGTGETIYVPVDLISGSITTEIEGTMETIITANIPTPTISGEVTSEESGDVSTEIGGNITC